MALPSFTHLLAFDAAGRLGTFTRAAAELRVTQPAISRRVAALEAYLGAVLFDRQTKPPQLTAPGQKLFEALRSGLSRLETVVQELRASAGDRSITISAGPGFAAFWLIPRLPQLQAAFPELTLRVLSGNHSDDATQGDLHIRWGDGRWPGLATAKILGEKVYVVGSPAYLRNRTVPLPLREIRAARLLHLLDDAPRWYDWSTWFEALGAPLRHPVRGLDFDSYANLAGAALAGHGLALCWDGLLDQYLASGALLRVSRDSVRSERGYFVTHRGNIEADSAIHRVWSWLGGAGPAAAFRP